MAPSEQEVAGTLKSYIADVQDNPQQVVKHIIWAQFVRYYVCLCMEYYIGCACSCVFMSVKLLQVFQKHKELIKRPTISKELQSERETLLARLLDYNRGT